MLIQLHHQFKDGTTKMIAQENFKNQKELDKFIRKIAKTHPLPKNAEWMWCKEGAKDFVETVKYAIDNIDKQYKWYIDSAKYEKKSITAEGFRDYLKMMCSIELK